MSFVIYTAIANDYDFLRQIPNSFSEIDFICFCTNDMRIKAEKRGWQVRELPKKYKNYLQICRDIKVRAHHYLPKYKSSLWLDGNIQITEHAVSEIIQLLSSNTFFATFKHPVRSNVVEEASICKKLKKDSDFSIDETLFFLKNEGFPLEYPLYETNVIFRHHMEPLVVRAMNVWYDSINRYSARDQLTLGYALWSTGLKPVSLNGNAHWGNSGYHWGRHKSKGIRNFLAYLDAYKYNNIFFSFIAWFFSIGLRYIMNKKQNNKLNRKFE